MEKIEEILSDLETKHNIEILFAVEAGSRAWGLESVDSDYDMRFIYRHKDLKKYLSLSAPKDTIDGFSDDRVYDWQGWDVKKALSLLSGSNPSIIEWIYSPIVYRSSKSGEMDFKEEARKIIESRQFLLPLIHHYKSMAISNYKNHIEKNENVKAKKYLYVIRPAGMVEWLIKCQPSRKLDDGARDPKIVEIDFNLVLNELKASGMSTDIYESIVKLIEKKKTKKELDTESRIACVDEWLERIMNIKYEKKEMPLVKVGHETYDEILFKVLKLQI